MAGRAWHSIVTRVSGLCNTRPYYCYSAFKKVASRSTDVFGNRTDFSDKHIDIFGKHTELSIFMGPSHIKYTWRHDTIELNESFLSSSISWYIDSWDKWYNWCKLVVASFSWCQVRSSPQIQNSLRFLSKRFSTQHSTFIMRIFYNNKMKRWNYRIDSELSFNAIITKFRRTRILILLIKYLFLSKDRPKDR